MSLSVLLALCVDSSFYDNILGPGQNGRQRSDDIFKIFKSSENLWYLVTISVDFAPWGPIDNKSALV